MLKRKAPIEQRLAAIERQLADHETRLPPKTRETIDAERLALAWRAPDLTTEEREFLRRCRAMRSLGWGDRLELELIARRGLPKPAPRPAADLIEEAAQVAQLTEHETDLIAAARKWLEKTGDVPDEMRLQLERTIYVRFPDRVRV
jgi:hypothetical protein